jgi:cysteinyl-tRNA synthetase
MTRIHLTRIHVCGGGLRALLIADVTRRVADVSGRGASVTWAFDEPRATEFNIYRPDDITTEHPAGALVVNCEHVENSLDVGEFSGELTGDPLALRLKLLELPSGQTAIGDGGEAALLRWRAAVAQWAKSPGAPLSQSHAESALTALADFDTARAIDVLRDVEADNQVAAGAKFETFAFLDRLFGLDLARDLGR